MKVGIISEGTTDQVVLKYILGIYLNVPNINIRMLQPDLGASNPERKLGGWRRVFSFCKSKFLADALSALDYVIIQIDTDVCNDYGVNSMEHGRNLSILEVCNRTKQVIIDSIGKPVFDKYGHKLLFAISYESIECWLLPLVAIDQKLKKANQNCCDVLNQGLAWKIDCKNKRSYQYNPILKNIKNRDHIIECSQFNNSFKIFIEQLEAIQA